MTYHKVLGFPEDLEIPEIFVSLKYTRHANLRIQQRVKGKIKRFRRIKIKLNKIIEVEVGKNDKIKFIVLRTQYDKKIDITLVLQPSFKKSAALVITAWFNHKKDNHKTLNKSKYKKI